MLDDTLSLGLSVTLTHTAARLLAHHAHGYPPAELVGGCRPVSANKATKLIGCHTPFAGGRTYLHHRPTGLVLVCEPRERGGGLVCVGVVAPVREVERTGNRRLRKGVGRG